MAHSLPPLAAGAMETKFKNLLKAFRDKHGLSEDGGRSNLSAIEENPSEMDMNLETIHDELEVNRIAAENIKFRENEKKHHISDITSAIGEGGGKKDC